MSSHPTPLMWADWDDYYSPLVDPQLRSSIEQHRGHYVLLAHWIFGVYIDEWYCATCKRDEDVRIANRQRWADYVASIT